MLFWGKTFLWTKVNIFFSHCKIKYLTLPLLLLMQPLFTLPWNRSLRLDYTEFNYDVCVWVVGKNIFCGEKSLLALLTVGAPWLKDQVLVVLSSV